MPNHVPRRGVLRGVAGLTATGVLAPAAASSAFATGLVSRDRPAITHGVQSGDVTADSAVIWTRSDRPARMFVQVPGLRTYRGPVLTEKTDFTGRVVLEGLPAGEQLRTTPRRARDIRFLWSGDQSGQGWGRNPDLGGFRPAAGLCGDPAPANTSPLEGSQYFGEVGIDADNRDLTVHPRDLIGTSLWSKVLKPITR